MAKTAWALSLLLVGGCGPQSGRGAWYGYYYENVTLNSEAAMSRPFGSARECGVAMRDFMQQSGKLAGYACARACPAARQGVIADCAQVVR